MKQVGELYSSSFFKNRHKLRWRAPIVVDALEKTFPSEMEWNSKIIDVGCATGLLVEELCKRGYWAQGLEGSKFALEYAPESIKGKVLILDLRESSDICFSSYNLVLSFEVAEHIDPEYADIYVDTLCQLGDTILITAAGPGQQGHHHVNCQYSSYWVDKFKKRGFVQNTLKEDYFRQHLEPWKRKRELTSYRINNLIFERREEL